MNSWSSFVRSTLKELHSGSDVPDYFGSLIPLVSKNHPNYFLPKSGNSADYKEEDDLISIDAVQVQNTKYSQQSNRQQPNINNNNFFLSNSMNNRNNNFNNNFFQNPNEINDDLINPNYNQLSQQKQHQFSQSPTYQEVQPQIQRQKQQQFSQQPNYQGVQSQIQRQKQQQIQNQKDISDSFEEPHNQNSDMHQSSQNNQSTPAGLKQSKEKAFIPETPEMVDYPSSASDVPWQDVPKSAQQPFPSESLINAIDQIGVYDDKQQQPQNPQTSKQKKQQLFNEEKQKKQQIQQQQQEEEEIFEEYRFNQQQTNQQQQESFNEYSFDQEKPQKKAQKLQKKQHQENSFNEYSFDQQQQQQPSQQLQKQQQQESYNEYSFDQQQQQPKKTQQLLKKQQQQEESFTEYSFDQQMQHSQPKQQQKPQKQPKQQHSFNEYSHDQDEDNEIDQEQADDDDINNSMDEEIDIDEKAIEEETSDIAPVPFGERFRILSGGIIDRYWSHIDTEVPRIVPQSKILTSFKTSKFIKYKNAMDSFAMKVEGKKHHLRFKPADQA